MEDLVGISEIRTMLGGVSRERVHQLTRLPDFPKPVAILRMGKIWYRADVSKWMATAGRTDES